MSKRAMPNKAAPVKAETVDESPKPRNIPRETITPNQLIGQAANQQSSVQPIVRADRAIDFDALSELAELAVRPGGQHPRDAATQPGDGDSFVRMLNLSGHCIAVSHRLVCDRLMDGYKFIDGESSVPYFRTPLGQNQNTPQIQGKPVARPTAEVKNADAAIRVWFSEMRNDLDTMRSIPDLDWDYMRKIGHALSRSGGNVL